MKLFVLLGPTAVGKTALSFNIAKLLGSPIINCDSRQIYKDMSIGTAAPTDRQLDEVKHYFVKILELQQYYSAAQYEEDVIKLTDQLSQTHDNLLLSGGSMMYIDAVCNGIDDIPTVAPEIREELKARLQTEGLDKLRNELKLLDPEYYNIVDLKNPKRIVHALEICYTSGKTYTSFRIRKKKERPFQIIKIGLRRDREDLFDRINRRVDMMMEEGLLEEAKRLYPYRQLNALNTVGYKELFNYIDGTWDLEFAVEKIKKNTRDYAKKQMTWFAHDESIHWFNPDNEKEIMDFISTNIQSKL
ncbi:MAG: tRNA (adenosine(37)-N6)-dimethylallyltransferase MiaA [Bacteroidaceae bacterium]|nr:tRNA (adenosine(37)-N6)-dimethylallyltransferase MiaA [Bacteroidaceae bacterium]